MDGNNSEIITSVQQTAVESDIILTDNDSYISSLVDEKLSKSVVLSLILIIILLLIVKGIKKILDMLPDAEIKRSKRGKIKRK